MDGSNCRGVLGTGTWSESWLPTYCSLDHHSLNTSFVAPMLHPVVQGDEEKRLGLPVTPMNDRTKFKSPAHMVSGFIDFVAQGTHDELEKVLPSAVPLAQNSRENRKTFETLKPANPDPPAEVATAQPTSDLANDAAVDASASRPPTRTPPGSPPAVSDGGGGGWSWCGCFAPAGSERFTDDGDKSSTT